MNLLDKLLETKLELSGASVKAYRNAYESNIETIGDNFYFMSQKKYLERLNKLDDSLNTKYSLIKYEYYD